MERGELTQNRRVSTSVPLMVSTVKSRLEIATERTTCQKYSNQKHKIRIEKKQFIAKQIYFRK